MSWSSTDRVQGKRVTLVCGVEPLALSTAGGRWQRSREVTRHLNRSPRAKSVLVTQSANVGMGESWWAAHDTGISFAAAIDSWLDARMIQDSSPLPDSLQIVIPLDTRIYFARVEQGIIFDEAVLAPGPAGERLHEARQNQERVYGFTAGKCTEILEEYIVLEPPPMDLFGYRYRSPAMVLLRRGLYHRHHFIAVLFVLGLGFGMTSMVDMLKGGLSLVSLWTGTNEVPIVSQAIEPIRTVIPEVHWTAREDLRVMARYVVEADYLHGDGLTEFILEEDEFNIVGTLPEGGYPEIVPHVARRLGVEWALDSTGWRITVPLERDAQSLRKSVPGDDVTRALLNHPLQLKLAGGPDRRNSAQPGGNVRVLPFILTTYEVSWEEITPLDLARFGEGLDRLPVTLSRADCQYAEWKLQSCTLSFESRTL